MFGAETSRSTSSMMNGCFFLLNSGMNPICEMEHRVARLIEFPHQRRGMAGGYCRTPAGVSIRIRDVSLFRSLFLILRNSKYHVQQLLVG
jgi:hypothetical protein